jgi:hypothetical protein
MTVLSIDAKRRKSKSSAGFELSNTANKRPHTYTTVTDKNCIKKG